MLYTRIFAVLPAVFLLLPVAVIESFVLDVRGSDEDSTPSCDPIELLRVKVASGRDPDGKRFFVARLGELSSASAFHLSSNAVAAAASAAIAAATASALDRTDGNVDVADDNNSEGGFENAGNEDPDDDGYDDDNNVGAVDDGDTDKDDDAEGDEEIVDTDISVVENAAADGDKEEGGDSELEGIATDDDGRDTNLQSVGIGDDDVRRIFEKVENRDVNMGKITFQADTTLFDDFGKRHNKKTIEIIDDGQNIESYFRKNPVLFLSTRTDSSGNTEQITIIRKFENGRKLLDTDSGANGSSCTRSHSSDVPETADNSLGYIDVAVLKACDENGNPKIVAEILPTETSVTTESPEPSTPTTDFDMDDCPEEWRDVAWADQRGNTGLHLAANNSFVECINELVAAGADLEARNKDGETALFLASRFGNAASVYRLIDAGADKEAPMHGGWRPLHTAARNSRETVVQLLLAAGADANAPSEDGTTPLWLAAYYDEYAVARILLRSGADPYLPNFTGLTPRRIAHLKGSLSVIALFGDDPSDEDSDGATDSTDDETNGNSVRGWDRSRELSPTQAHRFALRSSLSETLRQRKEPSGFVPSSMRSSLNRQHIHYPELRRRMLD